MRSDALVRPPDHHAERRVFGGFCYFKVAAAAAEYLSRHDRVAVLDIDYHHGNGTQDIFYQNVCANANRSIWPSAWGWTRPGPIMAHGPKSGRGLGVPAAARDNKRLLTYPDTMTRSIVVRRSTIHGNGVFAARDLPAAKSLIQYRGRLLTHAEADRHYDDTLESGHTFLFTLNDHYVIDANFDGNAARWINHSCNPNCQAFSLESADGDPARERVMIETLRPIKAGEELAYDYGIVLEVRHTKRMKQVWACRCGARNCSGTMLKPKKRGRSKA